LKPWWDVFTDYILIVHADDRADSVARLQVTQDKMHMPPCKWVVNQTCEQLTSAWPPQRRAKGIQYDLRQTPVPTTGRHVLREQVLHWFAKYFPYPGCCTANTLIFLSLLVYFLVLSFLRPVRKLRAFRCRILAKCFRLASGRPRALSADGGGGDDPKPAGKDERPRWRRKPQHQHQDAGGKRPMLQRPSPAIEQGHRAWTSEHGVLEARHRHRLYILAKYHQSLPSSSSSSAYTMDYVHQIKFSVPCTGHRAAARLIASYHCAHPLATLFKHPGLLLHQPGGGVRPHLHYTLYWIIQPRLTKTLLLSSHPRVESSYSRTSPTSRTLRLMPAHWIDHTTAYSKRFAVFLSEVARTNCDSCDWK
ncbi:hypothetical protein cypCar_00042642, partial [Cyprinus carpio]